MKAKKHLFIFIGMTVIIAILGGCSIFGKPTLTKKQQDNVVRWVARGYNVNKVEFLKLDHNISTGSYSLTFRVNDKKVSNIVQVYKIDEFNDPNGTLGLDPIEDFVDLKKSISLKKKAKVDISRITIIYLEN